MAYEPTLCHPKSLRGTSVRLADGQLWIFPDPPEKHETDLEGFGPEYLEILTAIAEAEDLPERRRGELILAIHLLSQNYDLRPYQLRRLLDCPSSGEESLRLQQTFADLASEHHQQAWRLRASKPTIRQPNSWARILEFFIRYVRPGRSVDPTALNLPSRKVRSPHFDA
jgi:hypothetical protein